jgi:antitoxin (DNA-binding transcriptional repressor) of toxin-antitoxin stability system
MARYLSVTEAARHLSEILGRVRFRGERFVLTKGGHPVAELGPVAAPALVRLGELPAILAELPHLTPEEAESFDHDLQAARGAVGPVPQSNPWAS